MIDKTFFMKMLLIFVLVGCQGTATTSSKIQDFNAEQIISQLPRNDLQFVSHWGHGYFNADFFPDGTIENLSWEMAHQNEKGLYEVFQARYQNGTFRIVNIDEVEDVNIIWSSINDVLRMVEKLPWELVLTELPTGDKYTAMVFQVHEADQKIKRNEHIPLYFLFEDEQLILEQNDWIHTYRPTYEFTFSVAEKINENFYRGQLEAVIFVPE